MVSFGLVQEGWENLSGFFSGKKSAKDILTPGSRDIFGQVVKANDPTPAPVGAVKEAAKAAPEAAVEAAKAVADSIGGNKYLKIAAIGGAAIIGLALLRRR